MKNLSNNSTSALSLNQINFAYDQKIIFENLTINFAQGKIHGLLGPNGAGKSTLIKLMSGLLKPSFGSIHILGESCSDETSKFGKYIGLLSDHAPLYPTLQVQEYLMFCTQIKKVKNPETTVDQLLERLNLTKVRKSIIQTLSTGYRQRVSLAQALVHNPPILILDEPTSGLDPESAGQLRELILTLSLDHTIIFSSHILHEVQQICSDVTLVSEGKILFHGKKEDMLDLNQNLKEKIYILHASLDKKYSQSELLKDQNVRLVNFNIDELEKIELIFGVTSSKEMNQFLKYLLARGVTILEIREKKNDLEEIFLQLVHPKSEQTL